MPIQKIIKDDLGYLVFSEIYSRFSEPKAKRKAFMIIEAAVSCLSSKGFEELTMQMIAREAGVSRTLLNHYFVDAKEVRETSIKYIRLIFQKLAVDAVKKESSPEKMIDAYVDACFYWVANFKDHSRVWLGFLHRCSYNKRHRALNTSAVRAGEERIEAIIKLGIDRKFFREKNSAVAAKDLQIFITGALISMGTEDLADPKQFLEQMKHRCLRIVGD